uniref:Uncharacterized protein n=1 Tax=Rhizophora mucronata TaxID=61149 RepID=A0A2P2QG67_RHIMU
MGEQKDLRCFDLSYLTACIIRSYVVTFLIWHWMKVKNLGHL